MKHFPFCLSNRWLLFGIIILAAFLRLYHLNQYPAGLNADEAAIGYNAYSLLSTGRDEYGEAWPIVFKSFGDYKPGGYFYLVLPFVRVLGLTALAVRLPSAILGIVCVWLVYLLAEELLRDTKGHFQTMFPLTAGFLLAVSPWHIHFSRGGWEANAALTMVVGAVLSFLLFLRHRSWFLLLSVILFAASMYTYQSTRVIAPLILAGLVLTSWKQVWHEKKNALIAVTVLVVLLLPLARIVLGPNGLSRFSGVGITADVGPVSRVNQLRGQHKYPESFGAKILHNRALAYVSLSAKNYLDHFDGNFLFVSGDQVQRSRVPETGELYLIEFPFLLLGLWSLARGSFGRRGIVIVLWLLIAPSAAALTYQTPSALRANTLVVPLILLVAAGLDNFVIWLRAKNFPIAVLAMFIIVLGYLWSVERYLHEYYIHYPQVYPSAWEYGFAQLASWVKPIQGNYRRIVVTDAYDQPYIEMLFYLQYPPSIFQKEAVLSPRDQFGFSTVRHFANFDFQTVHLDDFKDVTGTLLVGTAKEIPPGEPVAKVIPFPDGQPAFELVSR